MNKNSIFSLVLATLIFSCNTDNRKTTQYPKNESVDVRQETSEVHTLLQTQCYICHNPNSESHDDIIAPPMPAIKMRYSRVYHNEEEFVEALVSWTMDPREDRALMKGAVDKFKTMPKQLFKESDIRKIATYIYQNKLDEPQWFAQHANEMHGKGKQMRSNGNRKNLN